MFTGERAVHLPEFIKNTPLIPRRDTDAAVADNEENLPVCLLDLQGNRPFFGKFDRVGEKIKQYLIHLVFIGKQHRFPLNMSIKLQPFFIGQRLCSFEETFDNLPGFKFCRINIHPARLNLGQVKDVVDQVEQLPPVPVNDPEVFGRLLRVLFNPPADHQLRKAHDTVERGAQFMTHIGEELGL